MQHLDVTSTVDAKKASLATRLEAIGRRPFDKGYIVEYEREEAEKYPGNWLYAVLHTLGADAIGYESAARVSSAVTNTFVITVLAIAVLGVAGLAASAAVVALSSLGINIPFIGGNHLLGIAVVSSGMVVLGVLLFIAALCIRAVVVEPAHWERKVVGDLDRLPPHVRGVAKVVNLVCFGVRFEQDVLMQNNHDLDPVLWVVDPTTGEEEAIAVYGGSGAVPRFLRP